jgi:hypothetical protein
MDLIASSPAGGSDTPLYDLAQPHFRAICQHALVNRLFGGDLHVFERAGRWTLQINSVRLVGELRELFGLAPGDSAQRTFPLLGPSYLPHFVRGLLDSDGMWQSHAERSMGAPAMTGSGRSGPPGHSLHLRFASKSLRMAEGVRTALASRAGVTEQVPIRPDVRHGWSLFYRTRSAIVIGRWIYQDTTPAIRREHNYQEWAAFA